MKTSEQMQEWMKREECNGPVPLDTYIDPDGNPTVGWGHKLNAPYESKYTLASVKNFWEKDLFEAEKVVNGLVKIPLAQWQFDALVSFVFNAGENAFRKTMLHQLNAGSIYQAMETLLQYVHGSHGNVISGLVVRRVIEAAIFLKQVVDYEYH